MFQSINVIGRLGADPQVKTVSSGQSVCTFSVATTEQWTDRDGQKQERTEWFKCVLWGQRAETFAQYTGKGSTVFVTGKMQTRSFEGNDGQTKYITELNVDQFKFLSKNSNSDNIPAYNSNEEMPF